MAGATTTTAGMIDKPPRLHPLRKKRKLSMYLEMLLNFRPGFFFCLQPCFQNISGRICAHVDFRSVPFNFILLILSVSWLYSSFALRVCLHCCLISSILVFLS